MKRILALVATLALCLMAVGVSPVAAATKPAPVAPAVTSDYTNGCEPSPPPGFPLPVYFEGEHSVTYWGGTASGAAADIFVTTNFGAFDVCYHGLGNDAVSGWVAVVPQNTIDPAQIIQIGVVRCNFSTLVSSACVNSQLRYFWAAGGCGIFGPDAHDAGAATNGYHHYELYDTGTGYINGTVDGHLILHLAYDNNRFDCWRGVTPTQAEWGFERNDTGNSEGTRGSSGCAGLCGSFDNVRYGVSGQGWFSPGWSGVSCRYYSADATCNRVYPDYFDASNT